MLLNCSPHEMGTVLSAINEEPSVSYYILLFIILPSFIYPNTCVRQV